MMTVMPLTELPAFTEETQTEVAVVLTEGFRVLCMGKKKSQWGV